MFKIILRLLLILFSIVFTLCSIELTLRFSGSFQNMIQDKWLTPLQSINEEKEWKKRITDRHISTSTYNIYYFGESTMNGEPYYDTIPVMVNQMIDQPIYGKKINWVNFSDPGIIFSESKRRFDWVLKHKEITHPDLIVIYAGHNEFLQFHDCCGFRISDQYGQTVQELISKSKLISLVAKALHLYKVEIEERSLFDTPVIPLENFPDVVDQYDSMIQDAARDAELEHIPIIISTVAGNYADFEPNRSVFCENNQNIDQFKLLMNAGMSLQKIYSFYEAQQVYKAANQLCDSFAETHFRLGKVDQALGLKDEAWKEFQQAVDLDRMPIRAQSSQNAFIRSIKESEYVYTVDVLDELRKQSSDGLIGYNVMTDGHHPNLVGYSIISQLIAQKIVKITHLVLPATVSSYDFRSHFEPNDGEKQSRYALRAAWFIRLSTWRYDHASRLAKAREYLDKLDKIQQPSAIQYILLMIASIIDKNDQKAVEYYKKAKEIDPKETKRLLKDYWIDQFVQRVPDNEFKK